VLWRHLDGEIQHSSRMIERSNDRTIERLGRYEPLSFDLWLVKSPSNRQKSNAIDWSGRLQTRGQVRCNYVNGRQVTLHLS
jgi:hypothetical protein